MILTALLAAAAVHAAHPAPVHHHAASAYPDLFSSGLFTPSLINTWTPAPLPSMYHRDPQRFCDDLLTYAWAHNPGPSPVTVTVEAKEGRLTCVDGQPPRLDAPLVNAPVPDNTRGE